MCSDQFGPFRTHPDTFGCVLILQKPKHPYRNCSTSCGPWESRAQLGAQPSGLARPGWLRPCPGRPGWLDLEAPGASGSPWLVRCGLERPDLGALGALAGSLWTPWALLARPGWPTTAPSTRLAKKIDLLFDDPASMLPASCALERFFMPQI